MPGWIKQNGNRQLRIWTLTRRSMTSVDLALTGRGKIRGPCTPRTPVGMMRNVTNRDGTNRSVELKIDYNTIEEALRKNLTPDPLPCEGRGNRERWDTPAR